MISKIADLITDILFAKKIISKDNVGLYRYGVFLILSKLIFLFITVICGFLLNLTWESFAFYMIFMFLREYGGGFHADRESRCIVLTTFLFLSSVTSIYVLKQSGEITFSLFLILISSAIIYMISPVSSKENPLRQCEIIRYRFITHNIVTMIILFTIVFFLYGIYTPIYILAVVVNAESILLLA